MISRYSTVLRLVFCCALLFSNTRPSAAETPGHHQQANYVPIGFLLHPPKPPEPKVPDGPEIYDRAVNLLRDHDLSLMEDKNKRDKWETQWRSKFSEKQLQDDPDAAGKRLAASVGERHTYWMDPRGTKAQQEQIKSAFGGIGCILKIRGIEQLEEALPKDASEEKRKEIHRITADHPCVVHEVIEDSPSEKAGVKAGDIFLAVDGTKAEGMLLEDFINKIRGQPSSTVVLKVERDIKGVRTALEFKLTRALVVNKVVKYKELPGDVSYLKLRDFMSEHLPKEFPEALLKANKRKGLILDLRDNGGGNLEYGKLVCQLMIYEGTYLQMRTRKGDDIEEEFFTLLPSGSFKKHKYASKNHPHYMAPESRTPSLLPRDFPIVVLVNEHSASASEIVAGALQACQHATLVGKRTYGKGVGQTVFHLSHDEHGASTRMIAITTFEFRPGNIANNLVGLRVDVEVSAGDGTEDTQLNRAQIVIGNLIAEREVRLREEKDILEKRQNQYRKEMEKKEREAEAKDKATAPNSKKK